MRVELYGAKGVAVGVIAGANGLRESLENGRDLIVERAEWHPLDGSPARPDSVLVLAEDDVFIAVADQGEPGPVHAQWHDIVLDVGPYRVSGQMPTMPGFDPGRALARPTGEFVLLRQVGIALVTDVEDAAVEQPAAFVNRYVVDRVAADLMLGFFFPGAEMVMTGGNERSAAGATPAPAGSLATSSPLAGSSASSTAAPAPPISVS